MSATNALLTHPWAAEELQHSVTLLIDTQRSLGDALERLHASLVRGTSQEIDAATTEMSERLARGSAAVKRFSEALVSTDGGADHPVSFVSVVDTLPLQQRARMLEIGEQLAEELYRVGTLRLSIASLVTDLSEHNGRMLSTLRMLASFGPLYDRRSTVLPTPANRHLIEATA